MMKRVTVWLFAFGPVCVLLAIGIQLFVFVRNADVAGNADVKWKELAQRQDEVIQTQNAALQRANVAMQKATEALAAYRTMTCQ